MLSIPAEVTTAHFSIRRVVAFDVVIIATRSERKSVSSRARRREDRAFDIEEETRKRDECEREKELERRDGMMPAGGEGLLKSKRVREREGGKGRKKKIRSRVHCTRLRSLRFIDADIGFAVPILKRRVRDFLRVRASLTRVEERRFRGD